MTSAEVDAGTARGRRCPEHLVTDYVHGRLAAPVALGLERHLVACPGCRRAVEDERSLMLAMRAPGPAVSRSLQASLLSLATPPLPADGAAERGAAVPTVPRLGAPVVPRAPRAVRALVPLPVVDVRAPAQHRSPRRAAVTAGLAATATAAAALGLGIAGAPAATTSPVVPGGSPAYRATPANAVLRPYRPGFGRTTLTAFTVRAPSSTSSGAPRVGSGVGSGAGTGTTSPAGGGAAGSGVRDGEAESTP